MRALIDWAAVTFHGQTVWDVLPVLGLEDKKPIRRTRGQRGYTACNDYGDTWVMYAGREGMGIHAVLSGEGCRRIEQGADWTQILSDWSAKNGRVRRLDVALDLYHFDAANCAERAIAGGLVRGRWRRYQVVRSGAVHDGGNEGMTVYFGSPQSLVRCRIYDKGAQMGEDTLWHRIEIQTRDERAEAVAKHIAEGMPIGEILTGILAHYLTIAEPWYEELLQGAKGLRLSSAPPSRTLDEMREWFVSSMAGTLSTVFEAEGANMDWLMRVMDYGKARRSARQQRLLERGD